jgi:indole-3-glycerol phosphate synthase
MLDKIVEHTRKRVAESKSLYPEKLLERSAWFKAAPVSLKKYLLRPDLNGIIAEFKRKSPSKGMINAWAPVEQTTLGYMQAGASALSVLTEPEFFQGANADLTAARSVNYCPILRKDFVVDPYQITEARSIGADAILLIAAILSKDEIREFTKQAHDLSLEVLLEIASESELEKWNPLIELVGVNNRNLGNFEESLSRSAELFSKLPKEALKISESGIRSPQTVIELKKQGFQGFLIGEAFMRSSRPDEACSAFIRELDQLKRL